MSALTCPSCRGPMQQQETAGIRADVCQGGCGSLWLPIHQVRRLKDRLRGSGSDFLFAERAEGVRTWRNPEHPCPACRTTLLYRHGFSKQQETEIDQCSKCGGYWIDPGRLALLGSPSLELEAKKTLAGKYFDDLFEHHLKKMARVNLDTLESARQILHLFYFITPAEYLPKKPPVELE